MKASILAAVAGFVASTSALAINTTGYPEGTVVNVYPDGLPAELIPRAKGLDKRDNAGVYFCTDLGFTGNCVHIVAPLYECVNLGTDLSDQVTAVGPDSGPYCLFFDDFNCNDSDGHFGTYAPGYLDLTTIGFNDRISSYYCNPN